MKQAIRGALGYPTAEATPEVVVDAIKRAATMAEKFGEELLAGSDKKFAPAPVIIYDEVSDLFGIKDLSLDWMDAIKAHGIGYVKNKIYFSPKWILESIRRKGDFRHLKRYPQVLTTMDFFHEYAHHLQDFFPGYIRAMGPLKENQADFISGAILAWADSQRDRSEPLLQRGEKKAAIDYQWTANTDPSVELIKGWATQSLGAHALNFERVALFELGLKSSLADVRRVLQEKKDPKWLSGYREIVSKYSSY